MPVVSAGILGYRVLEDVLEVLLVHPGGPFWSRKDAGAWSLPKGLVIDGESDLDAARREFREETGHEATGEYTDLGSLRQSSGKIVHAFAVRTTLDPALVKSNTFEMEWPPRSGQTREFPEVDRAEWFSIDQARLKLHRGQAGFLDRLANLIQA